MKKTLFFLLILISNFHFSQHWNLTGNAGTNPSSNFIGTTDNQPLVFKTNNIERMRITGGNRLVFQGFDGQGAVWDRNFLIGGGNENMTGLHNTVLGLGSLTSNLTGAGNVAIGINSMSYMTSGSNNLSVGGNSMLLANSGNLNVALGVKTMEGYGNYTENVAVGYAALGRSNGEVADAVSFNTALGSRSLAYLKNGQNNIAIGYNTIKPLTSGNGNIAIGNHSGYLLTNASGNILIGDNVNATTSTSNNELNIGNWIIGNSGTIGIGQFTSQLPANGIAQDGEKYKLFVKDGIKTEKIKVDLASANGWADYVFNKDYKLKSLDEVEKHIEEKGHLPNIPSANEVVKNGINLGEMDAKLLEKIEELTLYMIQLNKEVKELKEENKILKNKIQTNSK